MESVKFLEFSCPPLGRRRVLRMDKKEIKQ